MLSLDEIERALVITAHPDDVDFGAAGTIANLTDLGATVTYCIVTDGQAGGFDDSIPRLKMASTRREEQTEAASKVGVSDLLFLGWMDGEVESGLELRHDLSRVIRKYRPQVVLTQSPDSTFAGSMRAIPTILLLLNQRSLRCTQMPAIRMRLPISSPTV